MHSENTSGFIKIHIQQYYFLFVILTGYYIRKLNMGGLVMLKWKYLFLTAEKINRKWQPRFVDGVELEIWSFGLNLYEFTNELGSYGWKLVTLNWQAKEDMTHRRFVCKKPDQY